MAAKQHQSSRRSGSRPMPLAFRAPVQLHRLVKARIQDHAGSLQDVAPPGAPWRGLLRGALRSADEILVLFFHPEMRRIIRHVGKDGHHGRRTVASPSCSARLKFGNDGNHHVRAACAKCASKNRDLLRVVTPNQRIASRGAMCGEPSVQPFSQHQIVDVLALDASHLAKNVQRRQHSCKFTRRTSQGRFCCR